MNDVEKPDGGDAPTAGRPLAPLLRRASLGYDAPEDRLLLSGRIESDGDRVAFHITRALALRLAAQVAGRLEGIAVEAARAEGLDEATAAARLEAQRRYAQSNLSFGAADMGASGRPGPGSAGEGIPEGVSAERESGSDAAEGGRAVGAGTGDAGSRAATALQPSLVAAIRLREAPDQHLLILVDAAGAGRARMAFTRNEFHAFLAGLEVCIERAQWRQISPASPDAAPKLPEGPVPTPGRVVH